MTSSRGLAWAGCGDRQVTFRKTSGIYPFVKQFFFRVVLCFVYTNETGPWKAHNFQRGILSTTLTSVYILGGKTSGCEIWFYATWF